MERPVTLVTQVDRRVFVDDRSLRHVVRGDLSIFRRKEALLDREVAIWEGDGSFVREFIVNRVIGRGDGAFLLLSAPREVSSGVGEVVRLAAGNTTRR